MLDTNINKYNGRIGNVVGLILCGKPSDEESVENFADLLLVLNSTDYYLKYTRTLVKGICLMLIKCVANERICLKLIQVLNINLSDKESKKN